MTVSTISSALWKTWWINTESQNIINILNWNRTAEQMIWEYFGLRKEKIMSDDWLELIDMLNEFRDPKALQEKKVQFVPYFAEKWMTEEMFYKVVPKEYVYIPKQIKDEQQNDISSWTIEEQWVLQSSNKWVRKNKG